MEAGRGAVVQMVVVMVIEHVKNHCLTQLLQVTGLEGGGAGGEVCVSVYKEKMVTTQKGT